MRDFEPLGHALFYFMMFLMSLFVTGCMAFLVLATLHATYFEGKNINQSPLLMFGICATVLSLSGYGVVQFSKCSLEHLRTCSFYSSMKLHRFMSSNPKLGLTLGFILFLTGLLWSPFLSWLTMSNQ